MQAEQYEKNAARGIMLLVETIALPGKALPVSQWIGQYYGCFNELKLGGKAILLHGNEYKLTIRNFPGKNPKVFFRGSYFEVYINRNSTFADSSAAVEKALSGWLYKRAEVIIGERLKHYCGIIGANYNRFCIKAQKTRWGSCSSKGNLNFNWRLVMAPLWVLDYVVVHELSHLKHMNHSKEFWNTVSLYIPDYKKAVVWLKDNGGTLKLQLDKEEVC